MKDLPGGDAATGAFGADARPPSSLATEDFGPDRATGTFGTPTRPEHSPATTLGTVIAGRYTLLEVIGEGGMGSVYLASQTAPVKRQVALKLIKSGMDSKAVLARFDAERQALALMDHPNIARIYDGGVTPAGQPFFVMELVKGIPLTDYCDSKRLTVDARLQLFVQVCNAVQHAHQKGIIHRDLKPGNVLVTEVDGRATPKVIDFGVAKATELKLTDMSFADTGAIVGTPAYMSPEQADPSSMDIDTRTDVYALGVMLYELLTGSPPIDSKQFKRGAILEMLRMVREVEPPRPSTKLRTADALPNIAANRSIEPAKLAKLLQGELDWVVMKALEKDRTRRYDTANGLAQDIQRYLADEVVEARPPSRVYRLKKFVRRNKVQVTAAALVLVALVAGVAVSAYFAVEANAQAAAAKTEAKRANDAADGEAAQKTIAEGKTEEAKAEAKRANDNKKLADDKTELATKEAERAKKQTDIAQRNERLVKDSNHAIKLDLALRAREQSDWARMQQLLAETHTDYGQTLENRLVTGIWAKHAFPLKNLGGHKRLVSSVAFSPDGKRIVTGTGRYDEKTRLLPGEVKVWDAETGTEKLVLNGHTDDVLSVAFSPDGKRILTGGWDKTARVWDAETGTEVLALKGHTGVVSSVAFSPDGKRIVTAGEDGRVRVWDVPAGTATRDLAPPPRAVVR